MKTHALLASVLAAAALASCSLPTTDADKVEQARSAFARAHAPHMDWARLRVARTAATAAHSGSAEPDWAAGSCDIDIDPAKVDKNWGASDGSVSSLHFVALHEMGHCHLYATPRLGWRDAGYAGALPEGLLDELWAMDATVMGAEDRGGMNWFGLGHEAFADAFAIAWLVQNGAAPQGFASVVEKREATGYGDKAHNVGAAGRFAISEPWRARGWDAERAARAAAAKVVMATGFSTLLGMDADAMRRTVATGWCQWTQIKEGQQFAREGYNYFLGRVGAPNRGMLMDAPAWAAPMPELAMPAFALAKLREGVAGPQDAEACIEQGAALLRRRHPG